MLPTQAEVSLDGKMAKTITIITTLIEGTFEGALQQEGKAGTDETLCQNCEQKGHDGRQSMARKKLGISTSENLTVGRIFQIVYKRIHAMQFYYSTKKVSLSHDYGLFVGK